MIRCLVLKSPGEFGWEKRSTPAPGPGQALVKVKQIGICGTDLHAFRGRQPFFAYPKVLGHEAAVEVVEVNAGGGELPRVLSGGSPEEAASTEPLRPGDLCVLLPYLSCGDCIACRNGKRNCCVDLEVMGVHVDGAMAEYAAIPLENLVLARTLTLTQMALVENQSIGAHAVRRAEVRPGEKALVIGLGPIGLGVVQVLRALGSRVIAMDSNPFRLEFCQSQTGVSHLVDARKDPQGAIREACGGELPTVVFDATGHPESMMNAFRYTAHGGRLVFVGLSQAQISFANPDFHRKELTLLSSRNATLEDFRFVMGLMEKGEIDALGMVTHRIPFDEAAGAFPRLLEPESQAVKAMLEL